MLLNGLGVVKHRQDGDVNDRPRRQAWMPVKNEFNDIRVPGSMAEHMLNRYSTSLIIDIQRQGSNWTVHLKTDGELPLGGDFEMNALWFAKHLSSAKLLEKSSFLEKTQGSKERT
ncbi:hypothetical protein KKI24_10810 [bacterium]|nr:hypothetical protein [bacterium]